MEQIERNGTGAQNSIGKSSRDAELILLTITEKIAVKISSLQRNGNGSIIERRGPGKSFSSSLYKAITFSYKIPVKEFEVSNFLSMYILIFAAIGVFILTGLFIMT